MMKLNLEKRAPEPLTILCLGAHSDDIEIGCGGTLLQLRQDDAKPSFTGWSSVLGKTWRGSAEGCGIVHGLRKEVFVKEFRDGFLPYSGGQVKDFFEELNGRVNPDLIFTHWQGDAHQDHRLMCELTWNTFRNHLILEYEIPKYDGDMGRPNVFVPLEEPCT